MPKQVYKITRFDGGLNSDSDPRDISDNELAAATDIDTSAIGRITMLGGFTDHEAQGADGDATWGGGAAGTGLFTWSGDYRLLNDSGAEATSTAPDYANFIALFSDTSSNAKIAIFEHTSDNTDWHSNTAKYDLGGASANAKLSFYAVN